MSPYLAYRPPLDWDALLSFIGRRAVPGVEAVVGRRYCRTMTIAGHRGVVVVGPGTPTSPSDGSALRAELSSGLLPALPAVLVRLRRLFDLDADPITVSSHLSGDEILGPLVARHPGLRVPGAIDGFEVAVRAVLGQQVSVRGATTLAGRLVALTGEAFEDEDFAEQGDPGARSGGWARPRLTRLTPSAERVADAGPKLVASVGLTRARAECVVALARATAAGELGSLAPGDDVDATVQRLLGVPGIGDWTAQYVAMRALHSPDAFPLADLGLRKAAGGMTLSALRTAATRWRPWRAYATLHLWTSLGD